MSPYPGPAPVDDDGDVFLIGKKAAMRMTGGSFVAFFFGLACLIALVIGLAGGDSVPLAGIVVFLILGVAFTGFGGMLLSGAAQTAARTRRVGPHLLLIDTAGFHERGTPHGEVFVPWQQFVGLEVVASDAGRGYTPYRVPQRPNSPTSMGLLTVLRMYPANPAEFAQQIPLFTTASAREFEQKLIAGPFGRAYYTESEIRDDLLESIRRHTAGRLGDALDETRRARYRGPQF